jgi:hypothetical protein
MRFDEPGLTSTPKTDVPPGPLRSPYFFLCFLCIPPPPGLRRDKFSRLFQISLRGLCVLAVNRFSVWLRSVR